MPSPGTTGVPSPPAMPRDGSRRVRDAAALAAHSQRIRRRVGGFSPGIPHVFGAVFWSPPGGPRGGPCAARGLCHVLRRPRDSFAMGPRWPRDGGAIPPHLARIRQVFGGAFWSGQARDVPPRSAETASGMRTRGVG